jgi:hypothetical protein
MAKQNGASRLARTDNAHAHAARGKTRPTRVIFRDAAAVIV